MSYYTVSGAPGQKANLASVAVRAEFTAIAAAFGKLPSFSGAGRFVAINAANTALEANSVLKHNAATSVIEVSQSLSVANLLDVLGNTADDFQAKFTRGVSDQNFVTLVQNGATGIGSGTRQSRFGLYYEGTGEAAIIEFRRGAGAEDGSMAFRTNGGNDRLVIEGDGRIYGKALHNNGGSVGGTTNQHFASGTYTPTLGNGVNVTSTTAREIQWARMGNVVVLGGAFDVDPNVGGGQLTQVTISLPAAVASNLAQVWNVGGAGGSLSVQGAISAVPASDLLQYSFGAATGNAETHNFIALYLIL